MLKSQFPVQVTDNVISREGSYPSATCVRNGGREWLIRYSSYASSRSCFPSTCRAAATTGDRNRNGAVGEETKKLEFQLTTFPPPSFVLTRQSSSGHLLHDKVNKEHVSRPAPPIESPGSFELARSTLIGRSRCIAVFPSSTFFSMFTLRFIFRVIPIPYSTLRHNFQLF